MVEHCIHLRFFDAGKPGEELLHRSAGLDVLKKRAHRYPGTAEQLYAADLRYVTFHRGAGRPIKHETNGV